MFTRDLVRDILTFPLLEGSTLVLMDVDDEKLSLAKCPVQRIVSEGNYPAKIIATRNRKTALKDAGPVFTIAETGVRNGLDGADSRLLHDDD